MFYMKAVFNFLPKKKVAALDPDKPDKDDHLLENAYFKYLPNRFFGNFQNTGFQRELRTCRFGSRL